MEILIYGKHKQKHQITLLIGIMALKRGPFGMVISGGGSGSCCGGGGAFHSPFGLVY
jgi:hypothetical protein